ncbi:hypothetical protein PSY47_23785, partial [Shigella flexneri]|nr:hypothetical protein [Shigella flexneri]
MTWNVIASLGWIWKSRFSYTFETPEQISEGNQELVDVVETPEPISEDHQELLDVVETPDPISEDHQEPVDVDA